MTGGGDTPEQKTLFKWGIGRQTIGYLVGELVQKDESIFDAHLYEQPNQASRWAAADSSGEIKDTGQAENDTLAQMLCDDVGAKFNIQVDQIVLNPCPVGVGEILPNWESYIDCTP